MPIPDSDINRTIITLPPTTTIGALRDRIPPDERRVRWIVVPLDDEKFAVFKFTDVILYFQEGTGLPMAERWMLEQTLADLAGFLDKRARESVDRETGELDKIRRTWNPLRDDPLVVLSNGQIVGVLKSSKRGGTSNIDYLDRLAPRANGGTKGPKRNGGDAREEAAPPGAEGLPERSELPHAEPPKQHAEPPSPAPPPIAPSPQRPTPRYFTARFQDHDPAEPLQVGETYTLAFNVELEQVQGAIATGQVPEDKLFDRDTQELVITVQLVSEDFDILTTPQKLFLPRQGRSRNTARLNVTPRRNGEGIITALYMKEGNIIQAMTLRLNVGMPDKQGVLGSQTLGRPPEQAAIVQRRDVSLWIEASGNNFRLNVLGAAGASATLPITGPELEQAINDARSVLNKIVLWQDKGKAVYQEGIDIPASVNAQTLPLLAEAGWLLFREIFLHTGADEQTRRVAARLRELAQKQFLKIQIASRELLLPWGILYMADQFDPNNINPELFLGFKHIVEHIPFQPNMDVIDGTIPSQPQLTISLNLNQDIDRQMGYPLIANQQKYWSQQAARGVQIITRTDAGTVVKALAEANTPDQIAYFYCHAVTKSLAEGGPNNSLLEFGENQSLTLRDLTIRASNEVRLANTPLIFINACESAELSPLFYKGFMPYFVDKGARGMIGTECPVPALFAADWAQKFFDLFLAGKSIGQIFLDLRREYYFKHNNLLGLLYAVYCDADTEIAPALLT